MTPRLARCPVLRAWVDPGLHPGSGGVTVPQQRRRRKGGAVYTQGFDPVAHSLGLTAIVAALPILTLIVLLGGLRMKAQHAAPIALVIAVAVATAVYGMPVDQVALSATEGGAFGLFPIMWTVAAALWVYNMTVESGHFAVLRRSIASVSPDQRIQAVLIAFCFGTLLEALAGFGAPAAITGVTLVALGFRPISAAALALLGNTAAVPFGALGIPITTLAQATGLDMGQLGSMVGRQTPLLGLVVPFILVGMVDGRRGIRQVWPAAAVGGIAFAAAQYTCSNHISVELTDIVASAVSIAAIVALLRVWTPGSPLIAGPADATKDRRIDVVRAYAPYVVILAVFSLAQLPAIKTRLAGSPWTTTFQWPGLDVRTPTGDAVRSLSFRVDWLPAAGTLMLISGLITMAIIGLAPRRALRVGGSTLAQLKTAVLVVTAILAFAQVANQSGQTLTVGLWAAGAGSFFAFLSPAIGWLGVAVTGSDTASNALFGAVQTAAAEHTGIRPQLLAAANASGGVLGKMLSAQHLAIAAAAVGLAGNEGAAMRKVAGWSVVLLLIMCALVYLQSTPLLGWMVPG
jgi:lactate permease